MKFRVDDILKAREKLAALPEAPEAPKAFVNSREAVTLMADVLQQLKKKGYSTEMLAQLLREQGIGISTLTLRQYLARSGRRTSTGKRAAPAHGAETAPHKAPAKPAARKQAPAPEPAPRKGGFAVRGDTDEL